MTALTNGVPTFIAVHTFAPGDGGSTLTMNRLRTALDRPLLPRIVFDEMDGFRSLPDAQDHREERTSRIGENPLPGLVRGKTLALVGRAQALTPEGVDQLIWSMLAAFGERDAEGLWSAIALNTSDGSDDTAYWQCRARVIDFQPDKTLVVKSTDNAGYQQGFTLGLRMSDPRWYWSAAETDTDAASVVATNSGIAPAEPTITITDPGATVTIVNTTTGRQLQFIGMSGATADLVIDFAARTATFGVGGDDARPYLDDYESDWWDLGVPGLRRGANTITQTGGTALTVDWKHASW